ncbi:protein SCAI [Zerene cesonia]|uniref:protein SCAI n=1 Tax=Zerene cesonia TaxID=33412 RepID=UPI0018E594D3|nr:protein SCAI [Zerene cesonia]
MNPIEESERKIIIEFCHLLEKSKVLFNGLRELPQYGHKQWQSYFGRTFDVYTKLWKFQQQHRDILDSKYGLKRWQIGEIASKIGQLYYHFYLRTSETAYLREAFAFYQAIRARRYYTHAVKEDKCELMVKKLRYYARFIVVSLLLNRLKLVDDLIRELDNQIIEYGTTYNADDQIEWTVVVDEVKAFLDAEPAVQILHTDVPIPDLSNRIHPDHTPYIERGPHMYLTLQDVIIVGSNTQQAKFSELTIDMYRILQVLEKEPIGPAPQILNEDIPPHGPPLAPHSTQRGYVVGDSFRRDNPHKYLLFKPTALQFLVYLASSCNDLPPNGAILLYISADGYIPPHARNTENLTGYDCGGFITSGKLETPREPREARDSRDSRDSRDPRDSRDSRDSREPRESREPRDSRGSQSERDRRGKDIYLLYPGDIYPYTRRPLFIIVESNCSGLMQNIPRHFNQPLVMLLSAQELPAGLTERTHQGNLLTLFLNNPLMGFCASCELYTIEERMLDACEPLVLDFLFQSIQLITRIRIDMNFFAFMGDEFLRMIILRYLFCECSLRMNRNFRSRSQIVRSVPTLPEELLSHASLVPIVLKIADNLGVRSHFTDVSGTGSGSRE